MMMRGSSIPSNWISTQRRGKVPKDAVKTAANRPELNALQFGEWWEYRYPFRHFRASHLLPPMTYAAVSSAFAEILDATQGVTEGQLKLKQSTANYDVQMLAMN